MLPKIAETRPDLFDFFPPASGESVEDFERELNVKVPSDLRVLWQSWGTGCLFETEDFFSPVKNEDTGESAYSVNSELREDGLPENLIAFHRGVGGVTCVDEIGRVFQVNEKNFSVRRGFGSLDEWLNGFLIREYGSRYGFDA